MAAHDEFAVVVVGAGAAGCVVAARLAEDPSRPVLLVDAGPDLRANPPPDMHDGWHLYREFGWGYESHPDMRGLSEPLHRGKLVGGTSWVTRFAMRGSPADYQEWLELGNDGWSFDEVLPYFRHLERDLDFGDEAWHGNSGPIPVTRYPDVGASNYEAAALLAFAASGFTVVADHNRPGAVGVGRMPMSADDGVRTTTADAYLPWGRTSSNLTVRPDTQVAHVVVEGGQATGIALLDGSVIRAGWVVLCAGTYSSPTILMRSGIGPPDHLESLRIPVRVGLAGVGANLSDHPGVDIDPGYRGHAHDGPLVHSLATFHSTSAKVTDPPDLGFWFTDPVGEPAETTIDVLLLKPRSRGRVTLRSADPTQPPRIELPGLADQLDRDRLCEAFLRGWEIANRPELRSVCTGPPSPAPESGGALESAIFGEAYSVPHTVGTCAMGSSPDDGAVVDPAGRVHGVDRLSVIDASIIPTAPSGFPHIITIMVAERLAQRLST